MIKVLIAVPCKPDQARYVDVYQMLFQLEKPEGTVIQLFDGWFPHDNRNKAVKKALDENFSHIFFVDDDQILPPYALTNLLKRDTDIVVCNLLNRMPPFRPYLFSEACEHGTAKPVSLHDLEVNHDTNMALVAACGAGGLLVKTDVFRTLKYPWFNVDEHLKTDDLYFCREARKVGYPIWCDLDVPSGHFISTIVWPTRKNGKWETSLIVMNAISIDVPAASQDINGNWKI